MKKILYITLFLSCLTVFSQDKHVNLYKQQTYTIDTLSINTAESDFGVNYVNEGVIVFSSPKKDELFTRKWEGNGQRYLELYKGKVNTDGSVDNVVLCSKELNSKFHEAELVFTKDKKTVYFTSNNQTKGKEKRSSDGYNNLQLYKANVVAGRYQNIKSLPFNHKEYSTGHPVLSDDDSTLYFVSDRPGGFGKTDLYKVAVLENDEYGDVINLGDKINSPEKEMFPFIDVDKTLYFSSNRLSSKGGLDVYGISLLDKEDTLYQLPSPINSESDDFAFVLGKEQYGFLSSDREGGKGDDDIYKLILKDCLQSLKGTVYNKKNDSILSDANVYVYKDDQLIESLITSSKGTFYTVLPILCNEEYLIKSSKENFKNDSLKIVTPSNRYYNNQVSLTLEPYIDIVENKIYIEPIYFDFDKYNIRKDAAKVLDKVVETMKKYPNIIVEGGSHTDSRASKKYNEKLSSKRAQSTVAYIISKGISSDRISSKGYGETELTNKCSDGVNCSEEEHQLNRRTEFKIIKK